MSTISRRELLVFFAGSAGAAVLGDIILDGVYSPTGWQTTLTLTPVHLPHSLPIYQQINSYLATGIVQRQTINTSSEKRQSRGVPRPCVIGIHLKNSTSSFV